MPDPTHLIQLQKTLSEYLQERRRITTERDELQHQLDRCSDQLATSDRMIKNVKMEIQSALDMNEGAYDPRSQDPRPVERYDQHYDSRREQRNDGRDARFSRYERPNYRNVEPSGYRSQTRPPLGETDLDAAIENIHRSEQQSNVRFADFRIPQAATIVLREANRPMHVSEIYRQLAEGGFEFRGQHQMITLAVSLSRSARFRKVAPGTFELDPAYQAGQVA